MNEATEAHKTLLNQITEWAKEHGFTIGSHGCNHFEGLPNGVPIRPNWTPLSGGGAHVIIVTTTGMTRAIRHTPYSFTKWEIVETASYASQVELKDRLEKWTQPPAGCWGK